MSIVSAKARNFVIFARNEIRSGHQHELSWDEALSKMDHLVDEHQRIEAINRDLLSQVNQTCNDDRGRLLILSQIKNRQLEEEVERLRMRLLDQYGAQAEDLSPYV